MTWLIVAFSNFAKAPKNATDGERMAPDDKDPERALNVTLSMSNFSC
jgi:hypothetical protein